MKNKNDPLFEFTGDVVLIFGQANSLPIQIIIKDDKIAANLLKVILDEVDGGLVVNEYSEEHKNLLKSLMSSE